MMNKTIEKIGVLLAVLTIVCLAFAGVGAAADTGGKCGDNLNWSLNSEGTLTITGSGDMYNYDNMANTAPWMKYSDSLRKLVLNEGITYIGTYAFNGCSNLTGTLHIPSTVQTIGNVAFHNCSGFTGDLSLPSGMIAVGEWAFWECSGFNGTLSLPSNLKTISPRAFKGCDNFTGTLKIPDSITEIQSEVFSGCSGFTKLILPSKLKKIDSNAFSGCSGFTGTLNIPSTVIFIGDAAFEDCSGFTGSLILPENLKLSMNSFFKCTNIESVVVPASTTGISVRTFSYLKDGSIIYCLSSSSPLEKSYYSRDRSAVAVTNGATLNTIPSSPNLPTASQMTNKEYKYFSGWYSENTSGAQTTYKPGNVYTAKWTNDENLATKPVEEKNSEKPVTVTVSLSGASAMKVGDTTLLTAKNSDGSNSKFTWKSSNSSIASVDNNGTVKALMEGQATITVTNSQTGSTASKVITVEKADTKPVEEKTSETPVTVTVSLSGASAMKVGDTTLLTAKNSDGSNSKFTWKSSNSSIASVDNNGTVKALMEGQATITVTNSQTGSTASKVITVEKADTKPVTPTTKSPFPVLGIIIGLVVTAMLIKRN